MARPSAFLALLVLAAILSACDSVVEPPTSEIRVGGPYEAATFRLLNAETGAHHYDLLAAGATYRMTLADDGTVTGRVFIPYEAFVESGTADDITGDFDVTFDGVYTESADAVTFDLRPGTFDDTFIDAKPWEIVEDGRGLRFEDDASDGLTFELVVTR